MERELKYGKITGDILKCAFKVFRVLGGGFVKKVYENALRNELEDCGHNVNTQYPIKVVYEGAVGGEFFADLMIDEVVIIELKVSDVIEKSHKAQLVNYLHGTGKEVGLLLCFGTDKVRYKRMVI